MPSITADLFDRNEIRNIIADAPEAISYWATNIVTAHGDAISFKEEEGDGTLYTVRDRDINDAAMTLLLDRLATGWVLEMLATRDLDATAIDCIVQVAAFGEVRYG